MMLLCSQNFTESFAKRERMLQCSLVSTISRRYRSNLIKPQSELLQELLMTLENRNCFSIHF